MARKRKRVPEVLWRLFGDRARTLANTILALIPPHCCCRQGHGEGCLSCRHNNALSFLVRSSDPPGYRKLLNGCYAVVAENAPPLPVFDPQHRWSQREIVRRSIEMIMYERSFSSNLICCRYDKDNCSSTVVDELTSSNWTVLLGRVGDALMIYLLKYASLFLPVLQKQHCQITGYPISDLYFKSSSWMPDPKSQHPSMHNESRLKRKSVGVVSMPGKQLRIDSLGVEPFLNSTKLVANNESSCLGSEELSDEMCERISKHGIVSSQKRKRQYRWQRQRKRRQLIGQKADSLIPCERKISNSDMFSRGPQNIFCASVPNACQKMICSCCSVFQNVPRMNKNAEVDRKQLFYRLENSSSMFPRKHTLYTLKPNSSGASVLFNNIFGTFGWDRNPGTMPCFHSENSGLVIPTCLYHSITKLLKRLIRNIRYCPHVRLLEKHCAVRFPVHDSSISAGSQFEEIDSQTNLRVSRQDGIQMGKKLFSPPIAKTCEIISEATADQAEPFKCYCPKKQVVSFVWAICRRIIPSPLLGEPSNWRILRKNIYKFIQLRKFEKFSLKECIHKLKISKFPLLSNKHNRYADNGFKVPCITDKARHAILECWVFWFFAHLVSPLVQANFYVTDTEHARQEVLYYRKSTWQKLMKEAECMKHKTYKLMTHASARKIVGKRPFGFSRGRVLPKKFGFRLLANLQAPSRMPVNPPHSRTTSGKKFQGVPLSNPMKYQTFKSANHVLHDVHVVLKGLFTKKSGKLGSSVSDYNDVYRKLVPFLLLLKNGLTTMPSVFIVVADVSKAFDSINHNKLLSVMKDVILDDEYALEKFTQVLCTKNYVKVHQHLKLVNQENTSTPAETTSSLATQGGVLVKKELDRKISKEKINLLLKEHITRNLVQLDNNFYLQRVGIPQGSILSTLLCSFYYEHMERNVLFPFLEKVNKVSLGEYNTLGVSASADNCIKEMNSGRPDHLLLRFIDDYLFISTSKMEASMFFTRLDRGIYDYNCSMNEEKYGLNFNMENRQPYTSKRLHVGKDGVSFLCWSGLLVNCSTLEIQADYTRYLNTHLSSTLTVSCQGKVGCQLKEKLRFYLLTKCHPIFYDSNINSPGTVRLNIYQAFLLCAMKFICYISELLIIPKFTPKFYFNAITASLRYMSRTIKKKVYSFQTGSAFRPKYDVKKKDVVWLGLYAYSQVLRKKQSCYKELLRLFRSRLKAYRKVDSVSPELRYAVDVVHSSVLWKIKY